ncbi:MAG: rod shape-determining protein RodA, partial [Bacteroidales bacterium]|nr:rod shape-determining protein RodA [Bacteroidales bacterium]
LISSHGFSLHKTKGLITALVLVFSPALIIMAQPDLGSALVYFAFLFVLYREGFSQNIMILGGLLIVLFILTLLIDKSIILLSIWIISLMLFARFSNLK